MGLTLQFHRSHILQSIRKIRCSNPHIRLSSCRSLSKMTTWDERIGKSLEFRQLRCLGDGHAGDSGHKLRQRVSTSVQDSDNILSSSSGSSRFQYTGLSSVGKEQTSDGEEAPEKPTIRLCALEPGSGSDPICCAIHEAHLFPSVSQPYEAISYTWSGPKTDIICNGSRLSIGGNLHTALAHLRNEDIPRIIWVDEICINQADPIERSSQVMIMDSIYQLAERVVVWLGEGRDEDSQALKMISQVSELIDRTTDPLQWTHCEIFPAMRAVRKNLPNGIDHLARLLERPYFCRMWVVQETVCATQGIIVCGKDTAPMEPFLQISISTKDFLREDNPEFSHEQYLYLAHKQGSLFVGLVSQLRYQQRAEIKYSTFWRLLVLTRHLQVSEPRDKLYSLVGLPVQAGEVVPIPDYESSDTQVYQRYASDNITVNKSLDLFSWVGLSDENGNSRPMSPSWVPDFGNNGLAPNFEIMAVSRDISASGNTKVEASVDDSGEVIRVKGRIISPVTYIAPERGDMLKLYSMASLAMKKTPGLSAEEITLTIGLLTYDCFEVLRFAIMRESNILDQSYWTCDKVRELLRVMVFDWDREKNSSIGPETISRLIVPACYFVSYYLEKKKGIKVPAETLQTVNDMLEHNVEDLQLFIQRAQPNPARRLCLLENGAIGWTTCHAQLGDVVCIFNGSRVPHLLRLVRNHNSVYWHLIGACWIDGFMSGEVLQMDGYETCNFEIH
jgi:hypothetical protein